MTMKTVCSMNNLLMRGGGGAVSNNYHHGSSKQHSKESEQRGGRPNQKLKRSLRSCEGLAPPMSSSTSSSLLSSKGGQKHSSSGLSSLCLRGCHSKNNKGHSNHRFNDASQESCYEITIHSEQNQLVNASFKQHGSSGSLTFLKQTLSHAARSFSNMHDDEGITGGRSSSMRNNRRDSQPSVVSSSNATFGSRWSLSRRQSIEGHKSNATFALMAAAASHSKVKPKMLSAKHMISSQKLEEFIFDKKWSKLRKYLSTEDGMFSLGLYVSSHAKSMGSYRSNGGTLLHIACQGHPPLDIIKMLCSVCPSWLYDRKNIHKHTPLHVAAAWGAHAEVVTFLVNQAPGCASYVDSEGRTPLHLHCQYCTESGTCDPESFTPKEHEEHREKFQSGELSGKSETGISADENKDDDDYLIGGDFGGVSINDLVHNTSELRTYGPIDQVVVQLHNASPTCMNAEDSNGMNPIEYCLIHGVDRETVVKMQRLSVDAWHRQEAEETKQREIYKANNLRLNILRKQIGASKLISTEEQASHKVRYETDEGTLAQHVNRINASMNGSNNIFLQMTQDATSMLSDLAPSPYNSSEPAANYQAKSVATKPILNQGVTRTNSSKINPFLQVTQQATSMLSDLAPSLHDREILKTPQKGMVEDSLKKNHLLYQMTQEAASMLPDLAPSPNCSETSEEDDDVKEAGEEYPAFCDSDSFSRRPTRRNSYTNVMLENTMAGFSPHHKVNDGSFEELMKVSGFDCQDGSRKIVEPNHNLSPVTLSLQKARRNTISTIDLKTLAKRVEHSNPQAPLLNPNSSSGLLSCVS